MNITKTFILILLSSIQVVCYAQKLPTNDFRSPVDFPITLSGNFAELRSSHFHSGIDIRTFGNGKKIYSSARGYISRIKISEGGYGKAIYINHPNGYTTVYAHLSGFTPDLDSYIKSIQYQKRSFSIDIAIPPGKIPVERGTHIAYSGNSGSSQGPHLHFEIRETQSEQPVNPLLFNYKIKDNISPKILNLYIYPMDERSSINGKNSRQCFPIVYWDNTYHLKGNAKITLHGRIGFALETNDYLNKSWSKCGIFSLQLKVNGDTICVFSLPKLSFKESRYIISHMDYELSSQYKKRIHKSFVAPNNRLSIYNKLSNRGIVLFNDNKSHKIEFIVKDVSHNKSVLRFRVKSSAEKFKAPLPEYTQMMPYNMENRFFRDSLRLTIPANCLYDTLLFHYNKDTAAQEYFSSIHQIDKPSTPAHKYFTLAIRSKELPKNLQEKALLVEIDNKGKKISAGGSYKDGWVETRTRNFGTYAVMIDTIPPTIKPKSIIKGLNISHRKTIEYIIKDDLSGIGLYRGKIDNKWVLFEYDPKTNRIFYQFDPQRIKSNQKHTLEILVEDRKSNRSVYTTHFVW